MFSKLRAKLVTKERIPSFLRSDIVYKFQCGGCNVIYYGEIKRHFKVRMLKRLGISALAGKRVKGDDDSTINEDYFTNVHLILKTFQASLPTTMTLKLP